MAKQPTPLPRTEKKLTPKEYEDSLVRLAKSTPDIVDEPEFRSRLKDTTIHRYEVGLGLLEDVEALLLSLKQDESPTVDPQDLDLAIKKIDHAVVQMTHGALAFNKAKTSGIRNILQVTRGEDGLTSDQREAAILGEHP